MALTHVRISAHVRIAHHMHLEPMSAHHQWIITLGNLLHKCSDQVVHGAAFLLTMLKVCSEVECAGCRQLVRHSPKTANCSQHPGCLLQSDVMAEGICMRVACGLCLT